MFGGQLEGTKFNDIWIFNLITLNWQKVNVSTPLKPQVTFFLKIIFLKFYYSYFIIIKERNGHSMIVYNNNLIVFGGIFEIT